MSEATEVIFRPNGINLNYYIPEISNDDEDPDVNVLAAITLWRTLSINRGCLFVAVVAIVYSSSWLIATAAAFCIHSGLRHLSILHTL